MPLAQISAQKCANPRAPAFRHRKNDDFPARKCTGTAAEIAPGPSRSWMPKSRARDGLIRSRKSGKRSGGTLLVNGWLFRGGPGQRLRCYFDRHSTRSDQPRTACIRLQTEVLVQAHYFWGRTGFDSSLEAQTACRGWFVGLVKNRTKTNKRRLPRSRSRGLIDRDVWSWTPATAPNVDSRLIKRRSDRAGW